MNLSDSSITSGESATTTRRLSMPETHNGFVVGSDDRILITRAARVIGSGIVQGLLNRGFPGGVYPARPSNKPGGIGVVARQSPGRPSIDGLNRNQKLKTKLGRAPRVFAADGMRRQFQSCGQSVRHA